MQVSKPLSLPFLISCGNIKKINEQYKLAFNSYSEELPSFELSKDGQNVVIIMLDRSVGSLVPYLMNEKPELKEREWYESADMSKYIAIIIDHLNHDASLSDLLDPRERIQARVNEYRQFHTISPNYTAPGVQS